MLWLVPLLPLFGAAICGVLHMLTLRARRAAPDGSQIVGPSSLAPVVACTAIAGSFVVSLVAFFRLTALEHGTHGWIESSTWTWIHVGDLVFDVSMIFDQLSTTLALVVTGVGLLIHVYSAGYMQGDPGYAKYFGFLNLFVFAMLILVLSSSLLGLFVGWEGVGLCSYLLIGFWYQKGWPAEAGQKAFVVNRIGDACFLLGSFLLVDLFGSLDLVTVAHDSVALAQDPALSTKLALAALLLFGGAIGKSAQLPLFVWLPDAMAGPTPVSALIHAATMVTAGVYLVVRLNPLFAASPTVLTIVGFVGAATALVGATSALFQRDIKKVLAYSTVSQLGYMFVALGAGAFSSAIFHLVTHAFFKGLLFLGAGSVIHGMHEEQDMYKMGGLRKHMPATHKTFLAGSAALAGLPLMSGYFSKDEILAHAFASGGLYLIPWIVGVITAALTAFYTWRMVALTFYGEERFDPAEVHPHESPVAMTLPLWILAALSVVGGVALGLPPVFHVPHVLHEWLHPVVAPGEKMLGAHHVSHATEWLLLALGAGIALFFAHRGFHAYKGGVARDAGFERDRPGLVAFLRDAWRIDSNYLERIVLPIKLLAFVIAVLVDQLVIDGIVNGAGRVASSLGQRMRAATDGDIKSYAVWMGAGAAALAVVWMWV